MGSRSVYFSLSLDIEPPRSTFENAARIRKKHNDADFTADRQRRCTHNLEGGRRQRSPSNSVLHP